MVAVSTEITGTLKQIKLRGIYITLICSLYCYASVKVGLHCLNAKFEASYLSGPPWEKIRVEPSSEQCALML